MHCYDVFKYNHTDIGFARVCFTVQEAKNPINTYYYCIQEGIEHPKIFRCSQSIDTHWEPEYSVTITGEFTFDLPDNLDSYTKNLISAWKKEGNKICQVNT